MKIQCDACNKEEASVFCTADEAALCEGCDHRIHHANKLASKHQRFSLQRPSPKQYPLCDVCLERRAFVFCLEDRAILCKDCDFPIHSANEHTQKHNRFLLTGIKLSAVVAAAAALCSSSPSANSVLTTPSASLPNSNSVLASSSVSNPPLLVVTNKTSPSTASSIVTNTGGASSNSITSARSISEYLIDTLPGWQVEDFLDSSFIPFGFCSKMQSGGDMHMLPQLDADFEGNLNQGSFSTGSIGIWVPQAPTSQMDQQITGQREPKQTIVEASSRSRLRDDNFLVPQISLASKRSRFLW